MNFAKSFRIKYKDLSDNSINKSLVTSTPGSGLVNPFSYSRILPKGDTVKSSNMEKASRAKSPDYRGEDKYGRKKEDDVYTIPASVMRKMYWYNPVVRASVDTIINEIISAKWQVSLIDIEQEMTDEIKNKIKEIERFFRHPNKNKENFATLLRKVALDLLLLDAGVIEKVKFRDFDKSGIAEMHAIEGSAIRIKTDEYGMIEEYWQVLEGKDQEPVKFSKNSLIYLQAWPRTDSIYGISPLQTLHNTVTAFLYAETYNIKFFENNATPRGIIDLGGMVPERELDRFRQFWEAEQQQKPHRLMILGNIGTPEKQGSGVKWIPIAMQPKDYDMAKYLEWLMKIILMVYGITPSKVGWTEDVKGAPATGQMLQSQAFKERAVYPIMQKIAWYFTEEILHQEFGSELLKFEFIEEMSLQDKLLKAQIHQYEIMGEWKDKNEIRKEEGLEVKEEKPEEEFPGLGEPEEGAAEGEEKIDIEGMLSGLRGEEKKKPEEAYQELETNIKDYLKRNESNSENNIKQAFDKFQKDIKREISKSIKSEVNKNLKKVQKHKKENGNK